MSLRPSLALMALGMTLAACGPVNRGLESVHQPVVQRTDYVFDVRSGGEGLVSGEAQRLEDWFSTLELHYGDRVSVDTDASRGPQAGRDAVASVVARFGLLLADTAPQLAAGEPAPGTVRVIVSRTTASVPNCPDWSRRSHPEFDGSGMSNYGCATNANLAAMVANPQDLVRGQAGASAGDAAVAFKAIDVYRKTAPTGEKGLKYEKISEGK